MRLVGIKVLRYHRGTYSAKKVFSKSDSGPQDIKLTHFAQVTYVLKLVNEMSIFFYIAELTILACLAKGCDRAR